MKTFIAFLFLAFMALFAQASTSDSGKDSYGISQTPELTVYAVQSPEPVVGDKYVYGFRKSITLTGSATITVTTDNTTLTYATLSIAQNAAVSATVANSIIGDMLFIQVTADGTNRVLTFMGNITATAYTVTASKTVLLGFVYNGSKYIGSTVLQVN